MMDDLPRSIDWASTTIPYPLPRILRLGQQLYCVSWGRVRTVTAAYKQAGLGRTIKSLKECAFLHVVFEFVLCL